MRPPRRILTVLVIMSVLAVLVPARAQPTGKVPRIGYLSQRSGPSALEEAFRQGLRDFGYTEGTNITVEYHWADFSQERLHTLAHDLVGLKVDLIVATGGAATALAAKKVTLTTPIVFTGGDPVGSGLVQSLARPGGNATGVTVFSSQLSAKRLALLKDTLPKIGRVAVLSNPTSPLTKQQLKDAQEAASALGLELRVEEVRDPPGIERVFSTLMRDRVDALLPLSDPMLVEQREKIVKLAAQNRIPGIYEVRDFVEGGGLMSYGTSFAHVYRRVAFYIDKILKGAKPADLPVEQPTRFELVINLKTAKTLGLTIPPSVLARADDVIQ